MYWLDGCDWEMAGAIWRWYDDDDDDDEQVVMDDRYRYILWLRDKTIETLWILKGWFVKPQIASMFGLWGTWNWKAICVFDWKICPQKS